MVVYARYVYNQIHPELGTPVAYLMKITSNFWWGVDLFFVLSGFLIGGIFLDATISTRLNSAFLIRLACRLLPVLTIVLSLYFILNCYLDGRAFAWLFEDEDVPF